MFVVFDAELFLVCHEVNHLNFDLALGLFEFCQI